MHSTPSSRLISFLGTGTYQPVTYTFPGKPKATTRYVPRAIAQIFGVEETLVLATARAWEANGHQLTEEFANAHLPAPTRVPIANGESPEELQDNFRTVLDCIHNGPHNLWIDITHGFRSLPFFAGAAVQYTRALGTSQSLGILYAAYEARDTATNTAPIWDLTAFTEVADWTTAIATLLKTGHGRDLAHLAQATGRNWGKEWAQAGRTGPQPKLQTLAERLQEFCQAIDAIRIAEILLPSKKPSRACQLLSAIEEARPQVEARLPILQAPLDRLMELIQPLCITETHLATDAGHGALAALARLYLAWGRLAEAAVTLREGWTCLCACEEGACPGSERFSEAARKQAEAVFRQLCSDYKKAKTDATARPASWPQMGNIVEVRNDIQHGGMNKKPLPGGAIRENLEKELERFAKAQRPECTTPRGTTWFVSRHPGAVEWIKRQGISVDHIVHHLDINRVHAGDTVIGTLPVHLAAQVCHKGAQFLFLCLDLPPEKRGVELSADTIEQLGACLKEYVVLAI